MNLNKDFYHRIEAYLCNGLSPSEKKALEKAIATDPQLKKQVEMQRLEWEGMESLVETDLRNKMADWDAEMPFEMPTLAVVKTIRPVAEAEIVPINHSYRWSIAASLALAMGALIGLWQSKEPSDAPITHIEPPKPIELPVEPPKSVALPVEVPPATAQVKPVLPKTPLESSQKPSVQLPKRVETVPQMVQVTPEPVISPTTPITPASIVEDYAALAEANYKKEPFELTETTRGADADVPLTLAEKAFQQGDFQQVVSLLKTTPLEKKHMTELNLLAHAYFQQKEYSKAQPLFEKRMEWSRLTVRRAAEWYLLLSYLAQLPQQQTQFDALAQQVKAHSQHEYYSKVVALLEKLPQK